MKDIFQGLTNEAITETEIKIVCPGCATERKVPVAFEGRTLKCKAFFPQLSDKRCGCTATWGCWLPDTDRALFVYTDDTSWTPGEVSPAERLIVYQDSQEHYDRSERVHSPGGPPVQAWTDCQPYFRTLGNAAMNAENRLSDEDKAKRAEAVRKHAQANLDRYAEIAKTTNSIATSDALKRLLKRQ